MAKQDEMTNWKEKLASYRSEALMVLVVIVTALAIWLVPADKDEAPPSLPQLPAPGAEAERPPSAEEFKGGAVIRDGDRARTFIAGLRADGAEPDADVVFAEAERLQGDGNLDDAYLLYRFAARQDHAQAALVVGMLADPAYHEATGSYLPEPNPEQAYKWYSVAADAGNAEAERRLQDLRNQTELAATAGDEQAQRLMLQWR
jgi:TPR repeat protein